MTPFVTITEQEVVEKTIHRFDYTVTDDRCARSPWLADVLEQLNVIASLPDGWDSHGAPTPDIYMVEAAGGLIACLANDPDLPKPYVNPTRNGGVQFEWEAGSRYFELDVVAERAATYLYCDDAKHVEETGKVFEDDFLSLVFSYIYRVGSNM